MQHPTAKIWGFPVPPLDVSQSERQSSGRATAQAGDGAAVPYLGIETPTHTPRCTTPLEGATSFLGRAVGTPWSTPLLHPSRATGFPTQPCPRFGHTAVALPAQDKMLLFGGRCNESVFNDLWLLSLNDTEKKAAPTDAELSRIHSPTWGFPSPPPYSASASEGTHATKSFSATWEQVFSAPTAAAPLPRAGHTAVMCSASRMLLFAGGDVRTSFLADVWALDTDTIDWSLLSSPADERLTYSPVSPAPPSLGDMFPHGRKGHTAVFDPESGEMIVFGGLLSTQRPKSDNRVWSFSAHTNKWRVRPASGTVPSSCMYHVAELDVENRRMYIFGGRLLQPNSEHPFLGDLYQYDLRRDVWRKIDFAAPFAPSPRMCCASTLFNGKLVLLHGGAATYMSDIYEFDLSSQQWRVLPNVATPRTRPTLCRVNNTVVLFGGCFQNTYHNDLHVVELKSPTLSQLCHEWIARLPVTASGSNGSLDSGDGILIPRDVQDLLARRPLPSEGT